MRVQRETSPGRRHRLISQHPVLYVGVVVAVFLILFIPGMIAAADHGDSTRVVISLGTLAFLALVGVSTTVLIRRDVRQSDRGAEFSRLLAMLKPPAPDRAIMGITRTSTFRDGKRRYWVVLDGERIGAVRQGESKDFDVDPGTHRVRLTIDWTGSPEIMFEVAPDTRIDFVCDPFGGSLLSRDGHVGLRWVDRP